MSVEEDKDIMILGKDVSEGELGCKVKKVSWAYRAAQLLLEVQQPRLSCFCHNDPMIPNRITVLSRAPTVQSSSCQVQESTAF